MIRKKGPPGDEGPFLLRGDSQPTLSSMGVLDLVLLFAAAVCFLLAAFKAPTKFDLVALGLLFWVLTLLLPRLIS